MSEQGRVNFTVTDTNNGQVYDCRFDYRPDGDVTVWIPYGVRVSRDDAKKIDELLRQLIHK